MLKWCRHLFRYGSLLLILSEPSRQVFSGEAGLPIAEVARAAALTPLEKDNYTFYQTFAELKYFASVNLDFLTDLKDFDKDEWTDFLKLKVKTTFTEIPLKPPTLEERNKPLYAKEWGKLTVLVSTVGNDFPVAYYVEINLEHMDSAGILKYAHGYLGFASAENLKSTRILKDAITDLVEALAIKLTKGKETVPKMAAAYRRLLEEREQASKEKVDTKPPK